MDVLEENTKLMVYVPSTASNIDKLVQAVREHGFDVELVTTEQFYKQIKFKEMSPRA